MIGDNGHEIPNLASGAETCGNGIEHGAFPVSGNGRVFKNAAQRIALC